MTTNSRNTWESGLVLSDAAEKFCNEALWNEHAALKKEFSLPTHVLPQKINFDPPLPSFDEMKNRFERRFTVVFDMRADVLAMLRAGILLGIGYKIPRRRSDDPIASGKDFWAGGEPDWDASSLKSATGDFEEVRIVEAARTIESRSLESGVPKAKNRPGRPSAHSSIVAAYDRLLETNQLDWFSLNANTEHIQRTIAETLNEGLSAGKIPGREAIRKVLGERFKEDKAKRASQKLSH